MPDLQKKPDKGHEVDREKEEYRQGFSQRLHEVLEYHEIPESEMANTLKRITHKHYETCRKWLRALSIPEKDSIVTLCQQLHCREEWLEYGVPPMMRPRNQGESAQYIEEFSEIVRGLEPEEAARLMAIARAFVKPRS